MRIINDSYISFKGKGINASFKIKIVTTSPVELSNRFLKSDVNHFSVENHSPLLELLQSRSFSFFFFNDVNHFSVENRLILQEIF